MAGVYLFSILIVVAPITVSAAYEWTPTSLDNAGLDTPYSKIKADPLSPDVVWVASGHLPFPNPYSELPPANGLYKTTDKGDTWTQKNDAVLTPEINIVDIAIDPVDTDVVYLATNMKGLFKSMNGGIDWSSTNTGITHKDLTFPEDSWCATAIAVDPVQPGIVYACIANLNNVDITAGSGDHPGFFKSTNGGADWEKKNQGLPPLYDPFGAFDLVSHTTPPMAITFYPPNPDFVLLGMGDVEINGNWIFGREAVTKGRVFYNTNRGDAYWQEASYGLPEVEAPVSYPYSYARGSVSIITFAGNFGKSGMNLVSHFGASSEIFDFPFDTDTYTKSGGLYIFSGNRWDPVNTGLPVTNDDENINSINTFSPVISPLKANIMLVGIYDADEGVPESNRSQVYATTTGGEAWFGDWSSGMEESEHGYTESSPFGIEFTMDQSAIFTGIRWDFYPQNPWSPGTIDDGIYRMLLQ